MAQITLVCTHKGRFWLFFEAIFKAENLTLSAGHTMFGFFRKRLFSSNFCAVNFWGEKCTLIAGQIAFATLEVREFTRRGLVLPNRALFTSFIKVYICFIGRSRSQEFIGQSDLNRNSLVVLIGEDEH